MIMNRNGFFGKNLAAVMAVVVLSMWAGASAMGGIEGFSGGVCVEGISGGADGGKPADRASAIVTERVRVEGFDRMEIDDIVSVEYRQGPFPGYVEIETMARFIDKFCVTVNDRTLRLGCNAESVNGRGVKFVVKVTAPELKEVTLAGVTSFVAEGRFQIDDTFRLMATGVNEVSFGEVEGRKMEIDTQGVGKIYMLAAELEELNVNGDGVSNIRLKGLNVGRITAKADGPSEIVLGGRCRSIKKDEAGVGEINTHGLIVESIPAKPSGKGGRKGMPRTP